MVGVVHSVLSLGDAVFGLFDALGSLLHGLVQIVVDHREQRLALGHRIAFGYQHLPHDTVNLGRGAHRGDGCRLPEADTVSTNVPCSTKAVCGAIFSSALAA